MSMLKEFKEFAMRGNVVDLAVGVVIGAAFSKIVTSIVEDMITPIIGTLVGKMDFSNLYLPLSEKASDAIRSVNGTLSLAEAKSKGLPVFAYGNFITVLIHFIIVAFCIFLLVKAMNTVKRKETPPPAPPTVQEKLLAEIRDLLAKK
jgi:large conductance mechanosensitive channel